MGCSHMAMGSRARDRDKARARREKEAARRDSMVMAMAK